MSARKLLGKLWGLALLALSIWIGISLSFDPSETGALSAAKFVPAKVLKDLGIESTSSSDNLGISPSTDTTDTDPEFDSETPIPRELLSSEEIKREFSRICSFLKAELRSQGFPEPYSAADLIMHEHSDAISLIEPLLRACFETSQAAPHRIEIDIFTSQFGNRGGDQIQLQLSLFEKIQNNKLYEIGAVLESSRPQR